MKIGVYFCRCGPNISEKIDYEKVQASLSGYPHETVFRTVDFLCSEQGRDFLGKDLGDGRFDRAVICACSPRDHEQTFMRVAEQAGMNPYLLQLVNIREQIAWVTGEPDAAAEKASRAVRAALNRVVLHDPLLKREIEVCPDVIVIGAGPAGLRASLSLAEAGRRVTLVERSPVIGGLPVRYEEVSPDMECGPCMMEPLLGDVLHGEHSRRIEILTIAEISKIVGSYGNFSVRIRQSPRYVDQRACIGCGECVGVCPAYNVNEFNYGLNERRAISFPFAGALPNVPFLDDSVCLRFRGGQCDRCRRACPVEGAIRYDDAEALIERNAGAVIVAVGAGLYDCSRIPGLGYGVSPDVYTSAEFERLLSSNGPTGGEVNVSGSGIPRSVAIVHCVGSLDDNHREYCSGICCSYAFKFSELLSRKIPGVQIIHFIREISVPGKEEHRLYDRVRKRDGTRFVRYQDIDDLTVMRREGAQLVRYRDESGNEGHVSADAVVLCPAVVPGTGAELLGRVLELSRDRSGFFEELHPRMDPTRSKVRGIFIAGTCNAPMDIREAMSQGTAAAGYVLSGLVPGRMLEVSPVAAVVDGERCSGCRVCAGVCPYGAISFDEDRNVAAVSDILCQGCGTCVAACPAGAIRGNHFTDAEITAEIEGMLSP